MLVDSFYVFIAGCFFNLHRSSLAGKYVKIVNDDLHAGRNVNANNFAPGNPHDYARYFLFHCYPTKAKADSNAFCFKSFDVPNQLEFKRASALPRTRFWWSANSLTAL